MPNNSFRGELPGRYQAQLVLHYLGLADAASLVFAFQGLINPVVFCVILSPKLEATGCKARDSGPEAQSTAG
jgi:hypothetical protein